MDLPPELWEQIILFSDLDCLPEINLVNRELHSLLSSHWKARLRNADLPYIAEKSSCLDWIKEYKTIQDAKERSPQLLQDLQSGFHMYCDCGVGGSVIEVMNFNLDTFAEKSISEKVKDTEIFIEVCEPDYFSINFERYGNDRWNLIHELRLDLAEATNFLFLAIYHGAIPRLY